MSTDLGFVAAFRYCEEAPAHTESVARESVALERDMMTSIPGKSCGTCNLCCQVLVIEELDKPPGPLCKHCKPGKGCKIYLKRPEVCRDFECEWLTERSRKRGGIR
jgi:hypothetical protein